MAVCQDMDMPFVWSAKQALGIGLVLAHTPKREQVASLGLLSFLLKPPAHGCQGSYFDAT